MTPRTHAPVRALIALGALALVTSADAQQPKVGDPPEAMNMRLVGHSDLQGRSAYMPTIHRQGDRYIAYVGHHGGTKEIPRPVNTVTGQNETNGTSIIDVTDPSKPKYLAHIPGQEGLINAGGAQMTRICDGRGLPKGDPNAVYLLRTFGTRRMRSGTWRSQRSQARLAHRRQVQGHPQELVGMRHRHRLPRIRRRGMADPAHDRGLRSQRSGQAGQNSRLRAAGQEPGATGAVPTYLHGMISTRAEGQPHLFRIRHQ